MTLKLHPLSEHYPARPETGGMETGNSWRMASIFANVATGRANGDRAKAIAACDDMAEHSDHAEQPLYKDLLKVAETCDTALMRLIGVLNAGLERKIEQHFLEGD